MSGQRRRAAKAAAPPVENGRRGAGKAAGHGWGGGAGRGGEGRGQMLGTKRDTGGLCDVQLQLRTQMTASSTAAVEKGRRG